MAMEAKQKGLSKSEDMKIWINKIHQVHPNLERICRLIWKLRIDYIFQDPITRHLVSPQHRQDAIDFWSKLFDHMIRECFLIPNLFVDRIIPLRKAIQHFEECWISFLDTYQVLNVYGDPVSGRILTEQAITQLNNQHVPDNQHVPEDNQYVPDDNQQTVENNDWETVKVDI